MSPTIERLFNEVKNIDNGWQFLGFMFIAFTLMPYKVAFFLLLIRLLFIRAKDKTLSWFTNDK